jgi:iron complex transport system substrate-binding protein
MTHVTSLQLVLALLLFPIIAASCGNGQDLREHAPRDSSAAIPPHTDLISLRDAVGQQLELDTPARRLISLAPNLTEMVFAINAGDRLVGRTSYCDYPPQTRDIPVVSDYSTIDYEQIVRLKPDLILMTLAGNSRAGYDKLQHLGLKVVALDAATVPGVINTLDTLGYLLGISDSAARVSGRLRERLDSIRELTSHNATVSVFVVIDRTPLVTVSRGFISDAIEIAGGRNIAAGAAEAYPKYSREALMREDPDVIIVPAVSGNEVQSLLTSYPEWKQLAAYRNHRIRAVPVDVISRPGPRIVDAIEMLHRILRSSP